MILLYILRQSFYRTYKSWRKLQSNPARSVIDGELVWNFLHLSINEKMEVNIKDCFGHLLLCTAIHDM